MNTATPSRFRRTVDRLQAIWWELDHAQRRLFESRTGADVDPRGKRSQAELDAFYAIPPAKRPLKR
jgi:hypothetical protein